MTKPIHDQTRMFYPSVPPAHCDHREVTAADHGEIDELIRAGWQIVYAQLTRPVKYEPPDVQIEEGDRANG